MNDPTRGATDTASHTKSKEPIVDTLPSSSGAPAVLPHEPIEGMADGTRSGTNAETSDQLDSLAKLDPVKYEQVRRSAADMLGVRVSALDTEVSNRRAQASNSHVSCTIGGLALHLSNDAPFEHEVDADELLSGIAQVFRRHLSLPDHADVACALWVVYSYQFEKFEHSPRLTITSPEKRCGKTTLLRVLQALVARPLSASNITSAALFRAIDAARPTLLVDEADTFIAHSDDIRGIINAGHEAGGAVMRTAGENYEPRLFSAFSPLVLAAIGNLPDTIMDRSIVIRMRRKTKGERVVRFGQTPEIQVLRSKCAKLAHDAGGAVNLENINVPIGLDDRAADNWLPLLAVAENASAEWRQRARNAAAALSKARNAEDEMSTGSQLLEDLRNYMNSVHGSRFASVDLCAALAQMEQSPWPEWRNGRAITPSQLSFLLRPFGIRPGTKRIGNVTFKGYDRISFEDAFNRYLPAAPSHRHNEPEGSHSGVSQAVTRRRDGTDQTVRSPAIPNACDGVTDREGTHDEDGPMPWDDEYRRP